ncbi:NAC transcription factor [Striga asiatica]|uniref:NAC transcription factor n=1 Tax=Striga asiatica TaxID=4170 RepID=A0A5A7Q132_STRAF|nr:NAC transcription factor [Striga asiatica]
MEHYFFTRLKKIEKRFSCNVRKGGTWSNKGQATPIFGDDKGVILGYRRTFRVSTSRHRLEVAIKEECKNYALCVLKRKWQGKGSTDCSCSCLGSGFVSLPKNGVVFRESGKETMDWAHELQWKGSTDCSSSGVVVSIPLGNCVVFGGSGSKETVDWAHELDSIMNNHDEVVFSIHNNNMSKGFRFSPSETERITYLLNKVIGRPMTEEKFIATDDFYGPKEPRDIFGDADRREKERYFFTRLKKTGKRFSRNVGKGGTWSNKGQATPIFGDDKGVILGYRRTFRYRPAKTNSCEDDDYVWLMTEYVLPDTALKSNAIKEDSKNYALCVLKRKWQGKGSTNCSCSSCVVVSIPPADCVIFGESGSKETVDWAHELDLLLSSSSSCLPPSVDGAVFGESGTHEEDWVRELEGSIMNNHDEVESVAANCLPPLVNDVVFEESGTQEANDEDWVGELEKSIMDNHDDVVFGESGTQETGDEDWVRELEESMDHDDGECLEKPIDDEDWIRELEESMDCIEKPIDDEKNESNPVDDSFEKELMDFFDFELPADEPSLWDNLPDDGRFFWKEDCSTTDVPIIAAN